MNARHLLVLALVCGVVGGVVGYALASYVARIYVEITQPAAYVYTRDIKIDAAPYQTLEYKWMWVADVQQLSDRVEYTVSVAGENVNVYKVCLSVGFFRGLERVVLYTDCLSSGSSYIFEIKKSQLPTGAFSIHVEYLYLRTTDKQGVITVEIACRPLP